MFNGEACDSHYWLMNGNINVYMFELLGHLWLCTMGVWVAEKAAQFVDSLWRVFCPRH